ncbi:hypothetical protein PIROE2DRAFT_8613 [Piromyces sp. E2]|nr:hypothetical protein PIROE2DRAFT_8613 [Piromyces sp. E2]|eukprot:OUM64542.1 hypothetical protein PIROE2DRAFT_8613 [Piromyces sp. E2]
MLKGPWSYNDCVSKVRDVYLIILDINNNCYKYYEKVIKEGLPRWSKGVCDDRLHDTFIDLPGLDSAHECWGDLKGAVNEVCKTNYDCDNTLQNKAFNNHGKVCSFIENTCLPEVKSLVSNKCKSKIRMDWTECGW